MDGMGLIDKYRDKVIHLAIIILAVIIAFNIYQGGVKKAAALKASISEEGKKIEELDKINRSEKKIAVYKKFLTRKETNLVMGNISEIAKKAGVDIVSLKPRQKEITGPDYIKDVFDVSLTAPSYEYLGNFISGIESSPNVYAIENIYVIPQTDSKKKGLVVSVQISCASMSGQ